MRRETARFGWGEFVLILSVFVVFAALLYFTPALYGYVLMEDMPPEWLGFFLLLWGTWLWGRAAVQRRNGRHWFGMVLCIGLAVLSFFVAGEEISWGQRLFNFKTPVYFLHRNVQREITLHNIPHPLMRPRVAALLLMTVYGIAGSVIPRVVRPLGKLVDRLRLPIPSLGTACGFALAAWAMTFPLTATDDEVGEVLFAFGLCATGFSATGMLDGPKARLPWRALSVVLVASLGATGLSFLSEEHRDHLFNVGHLQAGMAFEGRGMVLEAAAEYELLADYWETNWDLWVKVMDLYYAGGNVSKAQALAFDFIRINKRVWRPFEILAEIARRTGDREKTEKVLRVILVDEPYNDFVHRAFLVLEGKRWLYEDDGIGVMDQWSNEDDT